MKNTAILWLIVFLCECRASLCASVLSDEHGKPECSAEASRFTESPSVGGFLFVCFNHPQYDWTSASPGLSQQKQKLSTLPVAEHWIYFKRVSWPASTSWTLSAQSTPPSTLIHSCSALAIKPTSAPLCRVVSNLWFYSAQSACWLWSSVSVVTDWSLYFDIIIFIFLW